MFRPEYPVRTARLLLRPFELTDAEAMAEYQSRPDVCRYIPYEPRNAEVIRDRSTYSASRVSTAAMYLLNPSRAM